MTSALWASLEFISLRLFVNECFILILTLNLSTDFKAESGFRTETINNYFVHVHFLL